MLLRFCTFARNTVGKRVALRNSSHTWTVCAYITSVEAIHRGMYKVHATGISGVLHSVRLSARELEWGLRNA